MERSTVIRLAANLIGVVMLLTCCVPPVSAQELPAAPVAYFHDSGLLAYPGCQLNHYATPGSAVIETVSLFVAVGPTERARARLTLYKDGGGGVQTAVADYFVPLLRQGVLGGRAIFEAAQALKIPVAPGQTLRALVLRDDCDSDNAVVVVTLSGYMTSVRQPGD